MPDNVVIFSPLGGVGTTTLAINLACQLVKTASVQLIDADEFGAAWYWSSYGKLPVPVQHCPLPCHHQIQDWTQTASAHTTDLVVVDLPSSSGPRCLAALLLADLVVVPIHASFYGRHVGTLIVNSLIKVFEANLDKPPAVLLIPSQVDRRTSEGRGIEGALSALGEKVGPSVGWRAAFEASAASFDWIGATAPRSRAHREVIALTATVRESLAGKAGVAAAPGVLQQPPRPQLPRPLARASDDNA